YMTIRLECNENFDASLMPALSGKVADEIKNKIMVSAAVEVVPYGSLPRSERKSKRFFDNRYN
ncbi:MAG: phenylacetate--CoA ligase family protein, partial [Desulfobacterales bacterium]|nr:phenylacetate--CoA ligase family protein [Desulfobacterales bacterium]